MFPDDTSSSGRGASINHLPPELLEHILAYVDPGQLASVRLVSKAFHMASNAVCTKYQESTIRLARRIADDSTGDNNYGNLYHPCAPLIDAFLTLYPDRRGELNDAIIAAWMTQNDVDAAEMGTWLDHHHVLRPGPARVHPVQLAYFLSKYYD
jgi:hypothetical protein